MKYLCVVMIVLGVALFLYKDSHKRSQQLQTTTFKLFDTIGIGELLLVGINY